MKQYIVDAFTDRPFSGNPAAVCVTERPLDEGTMRSLAMENNLSETAFVSGEGEERSLRWFTPASEVALCGHATLASAHVILTRFLPVADTVRFRTLSGLLTVRRQGSLYVMDLPASEFVPVPVTDDMARAFGARPVKAVLGTDLVCVFDSEDTVRALHPDGELLSRLEGRIQNATARGREDDCVSRSFCPKLGIGEDPVCGSAHCVIAPYWAKVLGKTEIRAFQASRRGGHLRCRPTGSGRIDIGGRAVTVAVSDILSLGEP